MHYRFLRLLPKKKRIRIADAYCVPLSWHDSEVAGSTALSRERGMLASATVFDPQPALMTALSAALAML
jgi:hypothetical protein